MEPALKVNGGSTPSFYAEVVEAPFGGPSEELYTVNVTVFGLWNRVAKAWALLTKGTFSIPRCRQDTP